MGANDKKASNEFREQLKQVNPDNTNAIFEALQLALTEAVELEITTWVEPTNSDRPSTPAKPGHRLRTRINLVDGDIDNEVGSRFLNSGPYAELRDFHAIQVRQSRAIVRQNLDSLQTLVGVLVSTTNQLSQTISARASLPSRSGQVNSPARLLAPEEDNTFNPGL